MEEKTKAWREREQAHHHRASSQTLLAPTRPRTPQQNGAEQVTGSSVEDFGVIQAHG